MKIHYVLILSIFLIGCADQTVYIPPDKIEPKEPLEIIPPPDPIPYTIPETIRRLWVRTHARYYYVNGLTKDELSQSLYAQPLYVEGKKATAIAEWNFNYTYSHIIEDKCKIDLENFMVEVPILITLPKWNNYDQSTQELKNSWNIFLKELQDHEKAHADITIKHAKEFNQYLNDLGSFNTCEKLDSNVRNKYEEIFRNLEKEQREFDLNAPGIALE